MHYFQVEFLAHERQEELLREARERRLALALRSAKQDDGVTPRRSVLRGLLQLSWREREHSVCLGAQARSLWLPAPAEASAHPRGSDGRLGLVECRRAISGQARGETLGSTVRAIRESDHEKVISVVNEWWGGRDMAWLLPRLFFQHFGDTSFAMEEDGELIGFLIGFVSQSREGEAYIHFVGVRPDKRNKGVGRHLYKLFFDEVGKRGCTKVSCITSPVNEGSLAFHRAMGFSLEQSDTEVDGVPVHRHYDGLNRDRVVFSKTLYS